MAEFEFDCYLVAISCSPMVWRLFAACTWLRKNVCDIEVS